MKKLLVVGAMSALFFSSESYAMIQEEVLDNSNYQPINQGYQKTERDLYWDQKFEEEKEQMQQVTSRAKKRLGLNKQKKKNAKHLK